jgi:hypothetical protein
MLMQKSIEEERYWDAARIRDDAGAGLVSESRLWIYGLKQSLFNWWLGYLQIIITIPNFSLYAQVSVIFSNIILLGECLIHDVSFVVDM